jgi:primosomal protein N' (replication factor Y)
VELLDESPVPRTISIEEIVEPGLVDAQLLRLLGWVRSYYFGRMGETISFALPAGVCGYGLRQPASAPPVVSDALKTGPEMTQLATPGYAVLTYWQSVGREDVLVRFVGQVLRRGSAIVLAPECDMKHWAGLLATRLEVEPVFFHGGQGFRERRQAWLELRAGTRKLVIGVRSAVFAPVPDLAGLVVMDEHETVFKEERRPAFHARDVAVYRARLARCPVLLCDPTPSAETWHNIKTAAYQELKPDAMPTGQGRSASDGWRAVIDMRHHRGKVLAPLLQLELRRGLAQGAAILYLNRRGLARQVACNDCGNALTCPDCSVPMALDSTAGLRCPYCGRTRPAPESCPFCRGSDFRFKTPGVELVARAVGKVAPDAVVTTVLTESTLPLERGLGHVYVGTRTLLGRDWPDRVSLVAVVSVDGDLCRCEFRAHERVFQTLSSLARRAASRNARFLVQTRRPDERAIQAALTNTASSFLDSELEARKAAQFPPYRRLALLTFSAATPDVAETQAGRVARLLQVRRSVVVLGPVRAGRSGSRLLVKLPRDLRLDKLLVREQVETSRVSARIDVDPLDVL